jgi:hypothetical protein
MNITRGTAHSYRLFLFRIVFFCALILGAAMLFLRHTPAEAAAAIYSHDTLTLTIPYDADRNGSGRLSVELLDPEDHVLGSVERTLDISRGHGSWQQELRPSKPLSLDEIVWERVRYRFAYDGDKAPAIDETRSVSEILRRPIVHILGQRSYIAGAEAAIRIIVTDDANQAIAGRGSARVELVQPDNSTRVLFSGRLNSRGTLQAQFKFPAGLVGSYRLHYVADTPIGSADSTETVQLEDKASILLTIEKPIYQPGQTIHVRALALNRADHDAVAARKLTFELEDSRGNKVFKRVTETDKFGIASAEFGLADEVNLGTYHLRALLAGKGNENDPPANTAELALNVQRYVLPKVKVAVEFDAKDNKPKKDYRPGDHVTGTVRSNYFFGKPIDGGEIEVKTSSLDGAVFEAASESGKTDKDGAYHFDLKLPNYFAGRPLNQGAARVLVEATVKDSAGHSEARGEPITVTESPLLVNAIPESGTLIPNLDNQVFVLTSYPDGTPASAALTVHIAGASDQQATTDASGVAVIHLRAGTRPESLHIDADDHHGSRVAITVQLPSRGDAAGQDQILLRTSRAVFRAGDRIDLSVFSTRQHGSAYVDIVKDGQTILTRDLDLDNGHAELWVTATPQMAGTLDFNAYLFGRDARPVADHRLVFVQPADELKIETVADAAEYKPGAEARIRFRVTNSHGQGVRAALGLQVVDEAVFALAEKQPGFAKVFFYLEQEVMKPRYEIHSLSMDSVVESDEEAKPQQRDLAARALFSATEIANTNRLDVEFGRTLPDAKQAEFANRYREAFVSRVRLLSTKWSVEYIRNANSGDLAKLFAREEDKPRDAWGTALHLEPTYWNQGKARTYMVRSAGPDRKFNDADDLIVYVQVDPSARAANVSRLPAGESGGRIDLRVEHDRGPATRFAEVAGSVADRTGAMIPNATITLRLVSSVDARTTHADRDGNFTFSAIPAGRYEIEVSAQGFVVASRKFDIQARDRAVMSTTLGVGAATQAVTVTAEAPVRVLGGIADRRGMIMDGAVAGLEAEGRNVVAFAAAPMPVPMAATAPKPMLAEKAMRGPQPKIPSPAPADAAAEPHVRSYFPEALYLNPEIITDGNGVASITIPVADSITTWRTAMLASTESGSLGTGTSSLKVFQDFFVDLDLPVTLTQGDRLSIPVGIYNYSGERGDVSLKLEPADWFTLVDDNAQKNVAVDPNRLGSSQFTVQANRIGKFKLTLSAHMNGAANRADIVVREIEVVPNGREQNLVFNGRLDSDIHHELSFPANTIPDSNAIFVRLYPGPLSQVMEGMDGILRMPYGCFEQTSSSTYPNVLALDYMKRTKKLTPEVHAKAEGFIANGYQRLLTFEVPGGGFSWFGQAPANKILTAYGLMEFGDMAKVYDVDPRLITRTQAWLANQQQPDGSWQPDKSFINEGATNRYNTDVLRITAYLAWSLEDSGYQGPAVDRAKQYIETHLASGKTDAYTLAVVANFAVEYAKDRDFTRQAMQQLLDARTEKDDQVWWTADETGVYSTGSSAAIETTGLAAQALLKWGQAAGTVRKAMAFIASKKGAGGNWGTTQATIMALRALLLASQIGTADVRGTVEVSLNGKVVEKLTLTPENNDLLHQFVFKGLDAKSPSDVQLRFDGSGGLAYQVAGRYFVPWDEKPAKQALDIDVTYDRTKLATNDIATATATIRNNLPKTANMVMVDLGIPPGFDLLSEDLQAMQEKTANAHGGRLEKFSLTATQAILYFDALAPQQTVTLHFRLRAKYPIRAKTFQSRVYEYYDPDVNAVARPIQLEVAAR